MKDENLHITFSEIINGYSSEIHDKIGDIFIRHISHLESLKIEKQYLYHLSKAREQNLPSNEKRETEILSEGWTLKEENDLKDTILFIRGLQDNISKEFLLSKRKIWRKEMYGCEKKLNSLLIKKDYLIGNTSEKYANKQSYYYQIANYMFRDENFSNKIVTEDTNDEQYEDLIGIYNKYLQRMDGDSIKRIAISPFFTHIFYMAGDNAYYFYGRPVVNMTKYQSYLFQWGTYFKGLMKNYGDRLPKNMSDNPDDMLEWFEITQNVEKSGILKEDENADGGAMSIVGATKKDMEMIGIDPSRVVNMGEKIAKSGKGMLTKEDLFAMNG